MSRGGSYRNDFDDNWSPFLGDQEPAPSYTMSLEQYARDELRRLLRQRLPVKEDGNLQLGRGLGECWAGPKTKTVPAPAPPKAGTMS
jgi:hypothetical protein